MYVSCNWLKELVDFSYTTEELDKVLTMMGIEVEEIIDYKKKYDKFFTAKVLKKKKHPNADKLSVCDVDFGSGIKTVVCGASNVEEGQNVVFATLGAYVPGAGFTIEKRAVRNVESEGMICSQTELEVGEDSSGIWILPENTQKGIPLAEYLKLDDIILDVSLTPNKADCNSHLGIAREISAVNGNPVKLRETKIIESDLDISKNIEVIIEDEERCPRYSCRVIRNIKVTESPDWLKQRLILIGLRPVNVIVDVTNLVLMEMGQPLHAFDLNKISGKKIICKTPENGEKFTTLDGKERILDDSMLMICDAEKNIAIGGVMGGKNSEISNGTSDVLLESAFFNPSSIRKTAKTLAIQSDASYRFERGVDIDNIINALNRATALIAELTGGFVEKGIIDVHPSPKDKLVIELHYQRVRDVIGIEIKNEKISDMLKRLRFGIKTIDEKSCKVEVPFSRVDVFGEIDLIEEVARLYNYDNIEPNFSVSVSLASSSVPKELTIPKLRKQISDFLIKRGFNEIITQNMLDPGNSSIFTDNPIVIANPLGEELSIMRPSIVPAMLKTIERNIRLSADSLKLFEIGKSFHKITDDYKTFINNYYEKENLIIALSGKSTSQQWAVQERKFDFYDIKGILEELIEFFRFDKIKFTTISSETPVFGKNALNISYKESIIGAFGEVNPKLLKKFDIETSVYLIELDLHKLYKVEKNSGKFTPVSSFPSISRDLAFIINKNVAAKDVLAEIRNKAGKLLTSLNIFDVYEGKNIESDKKSVAFSLSFSSSERTLIDEEITGLIDKIIKAVETKFEAVLRKF